MRHKDGNFQWTECLANKKTGVLCIFKVQSVWNHSCHPTPWSGLLRNISTLRLLHERNTKESTLQSDTRQTTLAIFTACRTEFHFLAGMKRRFGRDQTSALFVDDRLYIIVRLHQMSIFEVISFLMTISTSINRVLLPRPPPTKTNKTKQNKQTHTKQINKQTTPGRHHSPPPPPPPPPPPRPPPPPHKTKKETKQNQTKPNQQQQKHMYTWKQQQNTLPSQRD